MRKTKDVVIEAVGSRDHGKTFRLTEMPARQAEAWADRAFLALAHSSVDLPVGIERSGMDGVAKILRMLQDTQLPDADSLTNELITSIKLANVTAYARLVAHIKFQELQPLMDELMGCIQFIWQAPGGSKQTRQLQDNGDEGDDIEEVATRQFLRAEVLGLHVNFLLAAVILNSIAAASEMREMVSSETMPTFRQP